MDPCKYLKTEDITPWHGDVFDHPDYRYQCMRDPNNPREILFPQGQCRRCSCYTKKDDEPV